MREITIGNDSWYGFTTTMCITTIYGINGGETRLVGVVEQENNQ